MKIIIIYCQVLFCCLIFSCRPNHETRNAHLHTTKDDLHRVVQLPVRIERVMSLTPSITEILYKIVDPKKIVGRTPHCNFPAEATLKPIVNVYPLDLEKLISLRPQVVFAKEDMLSMEDAHRIEKAGIVVFFLKYETCQDIVNSIGKIGKLMDEDYKAGLEADSMTLHLHQLEAEAATINFKPKVLMMISHDPLYVFGVNNFASDMLYYAGAMNAVSDSLNSPFPQVSREYILQLNPDIIIEPGKLDSRAKGLFERYPELKQINAYKHNRLLFIDEDLISRPGPRVIDGILMMKKMIHDDEK